MTLGERIGRMRVSGALICGLMLLVAASIFAPCEDAPTPGRCFRMAMVDDGKAVEAPARVTFIDGSEREEVEAREKRYCVPDSMVGAATLDLTFENAGSRFNLFHVRMDMLDADWDIAFGGKKYARDEKVGKSINFEESCTVHIHRGDEEKSMTITGCRMPVRHQQ